MSLTEGSVGYKPFRYPWAYDAWKTQQQVHWMPEEVPMSDDIMDWNFKLTPEEKHLLTQIFRFFTQADIEVEDAYNDHYLPVFKPTEIRMMLNAFANIETIHIASYSLLLETIGMPEVEYKAFLEYEAMKTKHNYMKSFNSKDPYQLALTLAAFGAFTEGLQLFASFAMLMNFPRQNKMKGMGQIVSWSVRDESLHTNNIIRLYHTWLAEHPEIDRAQLSRDLERICREIVSHEDTFIDLAFGLGPVEGMTSEDVKKFVRYTANTRCKQLGISVQYPEVTSDPLPWFDDAVAGKEHANFFEARPTEYSKAATQGEMQDQDW